jgi:FkbH-like protein
MRVLVISDIALEALKKKQLLNSNCNYSFVFSEDLLSELNNFDRLNNFDFIYIHFDCYFKRYRKEYILLLLDSILNLSITIHKVIGMSNLFSVGWMEMSLGNSIGIIHTGVNVFESQIELLLKRQNVYFFDIDFLIREIGISQTYNYTLGHLYQLPYTKVFLEKFANYLEEVILKIKTSDKKVIVLDCDNTLWRGIIGEDGLNGVICDLNDDGIVFYHFQQFLKSRKSMGFLLCLCSKNNEEDVKEVFHKKHMPLKWEDFVLTKVNWTNKEQNIKEIANELNIGTESFIFIDDNEFEIEIVKESIPDVSLFKMTSNYLDFINITNNLVFSKKSLTNEDLIKTELYLTQAKRVDLQKKSLSFSDYLSSLEIKLVIHENLESDFLRVSQLTDKTNQFNFNKRYFSIDELKENISKGKLICYTLRVSDKFGDYGLVGVILIEIVEDKIILENYILSCRILGRHIEFDFFDKVNNFVKVTYRKSIEEIKFDKTQKNVPAQNFFNEIKEKYEL